MKIEDENGGFLSENGSFESERGGKDKEKTYDAKVLGFMP